MDYKKLDEIATDFRYGKMPDKSRLKDNGLYPVWSGYRYVGFYDEKNVNKNEIVVVARGVGGTGDVKIAAEDCYLTNLSIAFTVNEGINPLYIYYFYKIKNLKYLDSGSAQSQITINDLKNIIIPIPSKKRQDKIVEVLNKIDKKIELNNKINNNLQGFARSQFNEKFSIKEANAKFKDLVNFKKKTVKSSNKNPDLGYYPIDVLPMNYLVTKDCKPNEDANSSLLEFSKYDILLGSMRVYFHRVCLAANNGITRNTTFVFEPKLKEQLYYSLLLIDRNDFIEYANRTSKGSTMPYAVWEPIAEYDIYLPTLEETKEFYELMYPIFEKMISNEAENRTLEQLRDTLLPKLMNGEIDLDKIEI